MLLLVLVCTGFMPLAAQDFGIEKMIYPTEKLPHYELNTAVPLYYWIKNFGDDIPETVVTLEVDAQGSSPRTVSFIGAIPKGFRSPMDFGHQGFYDTGFDQIPGIERVMVMLTPEGNAGDTIEVCVSATVEGDINHDNDRVCFKMVLDANKDRDVAMHILSPEEGKKFRAGRIIPFELSLRNDGAEDYPVDTLYGQGQILIDGEAVNFFSIKEPLGSSLKTGDSSTATVYIPMDETYPGGKLTFCYRAVWMSEDGRVELLENSMENNIRCVEIEMSPLSVGEIEGLDLNLIRKEQAIWVTGNFASLDRVDAYLYDMNGKKVAEVQASTAAGSVQLEHGNLPSGVYMFTLSSKGSVLLQEKYWVR